MKKVGFWDPRKHPDVEALMPWDDAGMAGVVPRAGTAPKGTAAPFLNALRRVEARASVQPCFGSSWCRVCGASNGSLEYSAGGFVWPEGYKHYVAFHAVAPDAAFEAFVLGSK